MTAPARRRPGAESPIKLPVAVEAVRTPATPVAEPEAASQATPALESAPDPSPSKHARMTGERKTVLAAPGPEVDEFDRKAAVTVQVRESLRRRAQTAVLRTAGLPGGHRSFTALVEAALTRELEALEATFNEGHPFEQNHGAFRTGRPFAN